jgi:hypothetical protein
MPAVPFPNIKPTSRSYTPGNFPRQIFRAQNGATTAVQFGKRVVDSSLKMTFANITDEQAMEIFDNFISVNDTDKDGNWDYVTFPFEAVTGAMAGINSDGLRRVMAETRGFRKYRYLSPPQVTSVFPGRSTVTIELRGYLDGA